MIILPAGAFRPQLQCLVEMARAVGNHRKDTLLAAVRLDHFKAKRPDKTKSLRSAATC